ncbi:ribosomal protein L11 methyltransferase [Thermosulfidibacter takaii ABI70S6]|uniref:Ribosomal protein L11 methyltransferase n=1 Tax=Thermosulfidibacter takaii (strain DSM 17441 / JCM 13301 / NBRC 103674 / ABI70S6) TaxID=1298851 RepID=A0A0S3QW35_THET7|nr:50S ribosomal protein L11 methyltransferase [Thermosulfidibacter takaii]BAT72548.1 ribosomal protein L11 methyltransferase [Thermosulfidibacter takaii ABI70S6]
MKAPEKPYIDNSMDPNRPIEIGKSFRITRPGNNYPPSNRVDLIIKRGAFGSGEHETTVSCLEELEKLDVKGKTVLDIGCGTGILAIAALKLGAQKAVCVDIAREAIETTMNNAKLNGVADVIVPVLGTLNQLPEELKQSYGVILANIYPEVLRSIAQDVRNLSHKGTYLIGSGVSWEDNFEIINLYKSLGFKLLVNRWLDYYTTFVLTLEA